MNTEHTLKLKDISEQVNYSINKLMDLYSTRQKHFIDRDLDKGKQFNLMTAPYQSQRAMESVTAYAIKKLGYQEESNDKCNNQR